MARTRTPAPDRNVTLLGPIVSRHTVSLDDLTSDEPALLAAARLVLTEIFQACGTAEIRQLTPEGALRIYHWARGQHESLRAWAEEHDVPIDESTRPNAL